MVFRALLGFVFSIVVWYYIFQVFWAVWTYPPFQTFRNVVTAIVIVVIDFVITHPVVTCVNIFLVFFVIPMVFGILRAVFLFCLRCLGFRKQGVTRGSYAANYQSANYGGHVPKGSTFARLQSQGMKGGGGRYRDVNDMGSLSWDY